MVEVKHTEVTCSVAEMKTSAGSDYFVHLRCGDREITPHVFKIWGRAAYEVETWKWFFGQGDKPDIATFDTERVSPPAREEGGREDG